MLYRYLCALKEARLLECVNSANLLSEKVAADLSHIATPAQVAGFLPPDNGAEKALKGADIVVIPAGVPRKPGMTRDDLFVSRSLSILTTWR